MLRKFVICIQFTERMCVIVNIIRCLMRKQQESCKDESKNKEEEEEKEEKEEIKTNLYGCSFEYLKHHYESYQAILSSSTDTVDNDKYLFADYKNGILKIYGAIFTDYIATSSPFQVLLLYTLFIISLYH